MKSFTKIQEAIDFINNLDELSDPYLTSIKANRYQADEDCQGHYYLTFKFRGDVWYRDVTCKELKSFAAYLYNLLPNKEIKLEDTFNAADLLVCHLEEIYNDSKD